VSQRQSECKDIFDDAADAQKFVRTFGRAISLSTPHLYISAVPFSPKGSRISKKFGERFGMVLKIREGWNEAWPSFQDALYGYSMLVLLSLQTASALYRDQQTALFSCGMQKRGSALDVLRDIGVQFHVLRSPQMESILCRGQRTRRSACGM
jgi:hypothetical protein